MKKPGVSKHNFVLFDGKSLGKRNYNTQRNFRCATINFNYELSSQCTYKYTNLVPINGIRIVQVYERMVIFQRYSALFSEDDLTKAYVYFVDEL